MSICTGSLFGCLVDSLIYVNDYVDHYHIQHIPRFPNLGHGQSYFVSKMRPTSFYDAEAKGIGFSKNENIIFLISIN